jgi:hypothetical protein
MKNMMMAGLWALALSGTAVALDVGMMGGSYSYDEPDLMGLEGTNYSLFISDKVDLSNDFTFDFDLRLGKSKVDYRAEVGGAEVWGITDRLRDYRGGLGYAIKTDNGDINVGLGVGQYNLDNLSYSTGTANALSAGRYDRHQQYNYRYAELGIESNLTAKRKVYVSWVGKYLKNGEILSKLSQSGNLFLFDTVCKQDDGVGLGIELGIKQDDWKIGIYKNNWHIADSNECLPYTGFVEPENFTDEIGVKISFSIN